MTLLRNNESENQSRTQKRFFNLLTQPVTIFAVLGATLAVTVIAWHISSKNVKKRAADRFAFRVKETAQAISKRMTDYEQVIRGGVGLFRSSDTVSRRDWAVYVSTLELERFYKGIQGLAYTQRIPSALLSEHTAKIRAEGFPEYSVKPNYRRDEYFSIIFIEPFEGRNLRAFGYDMFSEKTRRAAMERARDNNEPALSGVVTLVQETRKEVQKGFLLYMPVYAEHASLETVEQRRAALKGFVYSPFRVNDLMSGILGSAAADIKLSIYDNAVVSQENLLYSSVPRQLLKDEVEYSDTLSIMVAGRPWALVISDKPNFIPRTETLQPMLIGAGGIVVDIALFYILFSLSRLSRNNRILAEKYKTEKERYDIVLQSTNDVVWDWDFKSNTIRWNENLHYLLGYPKEELDLPPSFWYERVHAEDRERVVKEIHRVIDSGEAHWMDEYRFAKADGTYRYILDRGNVIHNSEGKAIRMVGSMIDITERKLTEQAQKAFSRQLESMVEERTRELERSNQDLQRFAHVASHDLKEPVRKIKTFTTLVYKSYADKLGDGKFFLEKVLNASDRLKLMIDGVLAYSTLNSAYQNKEKISLNSVLEHVKSDLELLISEKRAVIRSSDLPEIEGAGVLIYQLFYNLINNALKFSRKDVPPQIEISHRLIELRGTKNAEITVKDNGIGFSPEQGGTIFETFVRLNAKDDYEGTGLGLALCKNIVLRHGGDIRATGIKGQEARFVVTLPVVQNRIQI